MHACEEGHEEVVETLLEYTADANAANKYGDTALHFCAVGGHTSCAVLLIKRGARVNEADGEGHTPLIRASTFGHAKTAKLLLQSRAEVWKTNAIRTALAADPP